MRLIVWMMCTSLAVVATFGTANGQVNNNCKLDDIVYRFLQPVADDAQLTMVSGPCEGRDEALTLGPGSNPGIAVNFSLLNNRLSGSSCISILANPSVSNVEPVAVFYDSNRNEIGSIVLTVLHINITIGDSFARFSLSSQNTRPHKWLQLCTNGTSVEFYQNCTLVGSKPFVSVPFQDSHVIGLLRHLVSVNAAAFLNTVTQFYLLSCSGPDVERQDVVGLQCQANPPNCSKNTSNLSEVVSDYVLRLREQGPQPSLSASSPSSPLLLPFSTRMPQSSAGTVLVTTSGGATAPTLIPRVRDCSCSDEEKEADGLRAALAVVAVVLSCVALTLLAALIAVCVLWRKAVR